MGDNKFCIQYESCSLLTYSYMHIIFIMQCVGRIYQTSFPLVAIQGSKCKWYYPCCCYYMTWLSWLLFIWHYRYLKCTPRIYYYDTYFSNLPHTLRNTSLSQIQWILKNELMIWSSLSESNKTIESLSFANTHHKTHITQANKQTHHSLLTSGG